MSAAAAGSATISTVDRRRPASTLRDARRRPQVIDDAVGPAEALGGDDFLVVDALAAVAGLMRCSVCRFGGSGRA